MTETPIKSAARMCPRWSECSVNNCPLEPGYPDLLVLPDDKEKLCPMEKGVRVRIASQFPGLLKLGGLTQREHSSRVNYDRLSPAEKLERAERGKAALLQMRRQNASKT